MTRLLLILACLFALPALAEAQPGFTIVGGRKQVEIPFEYHNNFIILTLNFNGYLPLKFIFDTGAEHTILTKREIGDIMGIQYEREFRVLGSDLKTPLIAYLARRVRFDIPEKIYANSEDILVLQEDYFRFKEYLGLEIHGILSAQSLSHYVIRINYDRRTMTLYDRETYNLREKGFVSVPVELYRNKMYLKTSIEVLPDSVANVKLLLDTGAGLPLLLFSNTHPLVHPPYLALATNIGMGLGGYLEGFTGRVHQANIGSFSQRGVITYFQELDSLANREYLNGRDGLIGNGLLSHFHLILDYQKSAIQIKPSKLYQEAYVYDRSGLSLVAAGPRFSDYIVQNVLPNSPAAEADIRRDDKIIRINRLPVGFFSLDDIQRILQKKPGTKVRITVRRGEEKIKKIIYLRELI
ncbi:MAG: PDZ domain-containing protein [Saprospiraceae bacterium]